MTRALVHVTPRLFPQIDGLGDYSRLMAEHLRDGFALQSRFIVGDPEWARLPSTGDGPFPAEAVSHRAASELLRKLGDTEIVVLHYVPYGYHSRGVPFWINRALRQWKKARPGRRLILVFHELWASGPLWKSEFYLGRFQRRLVTELHRLCDGALTSTSLMWRMLEEIQPGKTTLVPIPSAFPQMKSPAERSFHRAGPVQVAAFGQEMSRLYSIRMHEKLLRALHGERLLGSIAVVGKGAVGGANPSSDIAFLRTFLPVESIHAHNNVSPERGAELLRQSDLFLSYYPSILVCKSSALTAALASGCIPVLGEAREVEPLTEGVDVLACDGSPAQIRFILNRILEGKLGAVGEAGWRWYDRHASWPAAAQHLAKLVESR